MKIVVISSVCSRDKYRQVLQKRQKQINDPSQKYLLNLIEGLGNFEDIESIYCLTILPLSASSSKRKIFKREHEIINSKIEFVYLPFINGILLRYISSSISCAFELLKMLNKNIKKTIIVCDVLESNLAIVSRIFAKIFNIKTNAIVTDIPKMIIQTKGGKKNFKTLLLHYYYQIGNICSKTFNSYIFITRKMNDYYKKDVKRYIVFEGSIENQYRPKPYFNNIRKERLLKNIVLYAGGIYETFGIKNILRAFKYIENESVELHLYGTGDLISYLKNCESFDKRIKYYGLVSKEEILEREREAIILINARSPSMAFAEYSFPSKLIEYLSTGGIVVTTKLPGIPEEYNKYFEYISENPKDIANKICYLLKIPREELIRKGLEGMEFVMREKNNIIQAKRILEFFKSIT